LVREALRRRPGAIHHPNNCFPSHHIIPMEPYSPLTPPTRRFYTEYYRKNISYSMRAASRILHSTELRKEETLAILKRRPGVCACAVERSVTCDFTYFFYLTMKFADKRT